MSDKSGITEPTNICAQLKKTALDVIRNKCQIDGKDIVDQAIYDGLQSCLNAVHAEGVVIHFGKNDLWMACLSFEHREQEKCIVKHFMDTGHLQQKGCRYKAIKIAGSEHRYIQNSIENTDGCKQNNQLHPIDCKCEHNLDDIFLLNPNQKLFKSLRLDEEPSNEHWYVISTTLREVFVRRNHAYRHFPMKLWQLYWEQISFSHEPGLESGKHIFQPPWMEKKQIASSECIPCSKKEEVEFRISTITLSLDLRKSTIAMEQATYLGKFADWMRDMNKELTEIALEHQAVLDKFTGDGIIVHFLKEDVESLIGLDLKDCPQKTAIELAVVCAARMVAAVDRRLVNLREFLQNDFSNLGASVGLAEGKAKWGVDHTGSPIVVGRGVVGACRAGDKAPAGVIRLTNTAFKVT